jgi:hypothetical protein
MAGAGHRQAMAGCGHVHFGEISGEDDKEGSRILLCVLVAQIPL